MMVRGASTGYGCRCLECLSLSVFLALVLLLEQHELCVSYMILWDIDIADDRLRSSRLFESSGVMVF